MRDAPAPARAPTPAPARSLSHSHSHSLAVFGTGPGADVYVNLDWAKIKDQMDAVGVKAEIQGQRLSGSQQYTPIVGTKA